MSHRLSTRLRRSTRRLHPVYAALEGLLAKRREHPVLAEIADPRLERTDRLEADLEFLRGPGWEDALATSTCGTWAT